MNTFRIVSKSPARRTDSRRTYYSTNIRTGYGLWVRGESDDSVTGALGKAEARVNALPNVQTFHADPTYVEDALGALSEMLAYNAPDNY